MKKFIPLVLGVAALGTLLWWFRSEEIELDQSELREHLNALIRSNFAESAYDDFQERHKHAVMTSLEQMKSEGLLESFQVTDIHDSISIDLVPKTTVRKLRVRAS